MSLEKKEDWRELCRAASQERDPSRLLELVDQLNETLDAREAARSNASMDASRASEPPTAPELE